MTAHQQTPPATITTTPPQAQQPFFLVGPSFSFPVQIQPIFFVIMTILN
jgi:hypothetical protein